MIFTSLKPKNQQMPDYSLMESHCKSHSAMSERVIDHFLMYYAADREGFEKIMNHEFSKYRHLDFGQVQESFINLSKAEYIVSRIFLKNGLIKKYLNHVAIKQLSPDEFHFLQRQSMQPWRFSFAVILNNPADCFYEMQDVFTQEQYLLYSPSIKIQTQTKNPLLWFNLIGFNGQCWQTFGVVSSFMSFDEDDIFFFATELNSCISNEEDLINEVEKNPIPFFMLTIGSEIPRVFHKGHAFEYNTATDELPLFSSDQFKNKFQIEWNEGVYKLTLKNWGEFPHYATAYVDEKKNLLFRIAFTDRGFYELSKSFDACGLNLSENADLHLSLTMHSTAKNILKKDIPINPYESLFSASASDDEGADRSAGLERHNYFICLAIPYVNEGKQPDLIELANEAGIQPDEAKKLWDILTSAGKS
jgi:hypothetical protein